jgi:hypothetical protein
MAPIFDPPTSFALGSANGSSCPTGQITSAAACQSAAAVGARLYRGSVTGSFVPSGCYWLTIGGSFYYNTNARGNGNFFAQPVCAGARGLCGVLVSMKPFALHRRFHRALARSSGCKRGGETCLCRV